MIKNLELFEYSIKNPEPLLDNFYFKDNEIIIPKSQNKKNKLSDTNKKLLENITAFKVAKEKNEKTLRTKIIKEIENLLLVGNMNNTEFSSFFTTIDMSYSSYKKLDKSKRGKFIEIALEKYLESRHALYLNHGYSNSTLQAIRDSKSHKQSGSLANNKMSKLLEDKRFKLCDLENQIIKNKDYLFIDKSGKNIFKKYLKENKIRLSWSKNHENKIPDLMFKKGNDVFIVEHKHMHEGGGGQNKQINEIINFIGERENLAKIKVHYVSFMDGRYFNLFARKHNDPKVLTQIKKIRVNLNKCPNNYFVNTEGFKKLIEKF